MYTHRDTLTETFNTTDMKKVNIRRSGANLQNIMLDL